MSGGKEIFRARAVVKEYIPGRGFFGRSRRPVRALDGVDLSIDEGEVVALVGESGSGKSTFARIAVGLEPPTSGSIRLGGIDIAPGDKAALRAARRRMQIIFQDPSGSLNPRITAGEALAEVIRVHRRAPRRAAKEAAVDLLERVGLGGDDYRRYPHEFSGGQRQRIAIARSLAASPRFLVADEPLSALDVSIQAQILHLLIRLKKEFALTLLFITHNLAVVENIADRVAVLYRGRIQEEGPAGLLLRTPLHPYTKELVAAAVLFRPGGGRPVADLSSAVLPDPPAAEGCPFEPRCPIARARCVGARIEAIDTGGGRKVACLRATGEDTPA